MQTIFDVTMFGAIGDGSTDDTAALQAAFDAAAEVHGCVTVPPGIYRCGKLHLGAGVSLRGEAAWQYGTAGASVFSLCDAGADCLLDISYAYGCEIRGMCFEGNMLGNGIHGIKLQYDEYNGGRREDTFTVDDCRAAHFSGDGLHINHGWCFSVRHSHFAFCRGAGIYLDGWDGFILDNWMSGNCSAGFLGGPVASSLTITGNRVEWNREAGFKIRNGDSINITGNFFDRSYGPALALGSGETNDLFGRTNYPDLVSDVTVTGNVFRRSGKPRELPFDDVFDSSHIRLTHCENCVVVGNTFKYGRDDGGGGIDSPEYSVVLRDNLACIVRDNVMEKGSMKKNIIDLGDNREVICEGNVGDPVDR